VVEIGSGIIRVLNRIAIDPSIKQAKIAKGMDISRSAINQHWKRLEEHHNFKIRSNLDYGSIGFHYVYGWAVSQDESDSLDKFQNWLTRNPFTLALHRSLMSSRMDFRIFFQSVVPTGKSLLEYLEFLEKFTKRPYSLQISHSFTKSIASHLNFAYFDGSDWAFESGYRFQASIDAAKSYASVLPVVKSIYQSKPQSFNLIPSIIGSALELDYHSTSSSVSKILSKYLIEVPSERTLRRRINEYRKSKALAYIELDGIGLTKQVIITLEASENNDNYKLLQAQSTTLPKVRVLSGPNSLALLLEIPESSDWFHISNAMSNVIGSESKMCTFIAEQIPFRKWLEDVVYYKQSQHSQ